MCKGVHVCACVSMFVHECIHVCDAVYLCICVHLCVCVHVHIFSCAHVYECAFTQVCLCVHECASVCVCVRERERERERCSSRVTCCWPGDYMKALAEKPLQGPFYNTTDQSGLFSWFLLFVPLFNGLILSAYFNFSNLKDVIPFLYSSFIISYLS